MSWQAKTSLTSTQVDDVVLADQLVKTAGSVMCPAQQSLCTFDVSLKEDEVCVIYLISGLRSFRNVLEIIFLIFQMNIELFEMTFSFENIVSKYY